MVVLARSISPVSFVNSPKRLEGFDARRPIFETLAHVVNNAYGPFADFLKATSPGYILPTRFKFDLEGATPSFPSMQDLQDVFPALSLAIRRIPLTQQGRFSLPEGFDMGSINGLSLGLPQMKALLEQYSDVLEGRPVREARIKDTLAHFGTVIHEVEGLRTLEASRSTLLESDLIRAAALRAALKELGEVSAVVEEKTIVLHAAGEREPIATLLD